jgi:CRISPR-associated endoribonuclease Cas6
VATPFHGSHSTNLYALQLRLRPLSKGTLMPFSGELVHGAFLHWLRETAPEVALWLHEGQKRRFFTCSSLHFNRSTQSLCRAERENIHLPLDPQETYIIRLTLLLGDLFSVFHEALMPFNLSTLETRRSPFLQLGKQLFLLEEVVLLPDGSSSWTGFTSLVQLVEQARQASLERLATLTFEFDSLTTFSRGNRKVGYGSHPVLVPLPEYVFQNLLRRWEDIAPPELAHVVQREPLERYLQEDGVVIVDYTFKPHHVHFTTHVQRGFLGDCTYQLRGFQEKATPDASLTLQQQIYLLSLLAFYTGTGYKTAMGLGQTSIKRTA